MGVGDGVDDLVPAVVPGTGGRGQGQAEKGEENAGHGLFMPLPAKNRETGLGNLRLQTLLHSRLCW
jgi:hypothetical protein